MFLRISKTMSALVVTLFFLGALPSGADVSAACTEETYDLLATSYLQINYTEYSQELEQQFAAGSCNLTYSSNATCTIDYNTLSYNADVKAACLSARGQVFFVDSTLVCSYDSFSFTYNTNNYLLCVGQSCNKDNVEVEFDKINDAQDSSYVANLGGGITCSANTTIKGSTGNGASGSTGNGASGPTGNGASGVMLSTTAIMVVVMSKLLVLSQLM